MVLKEMRFAFLVICVYVVTSQIAVGTGSKNYYMVEEKVNFFQAFLSCEAEGMELASVLNADEEKDLGFLLKDVNKTGGQYGGFWLSGTNLAQINTSNYYWLTGGKRVLYTDWLPGEPNNFNDNEHCIQYAEYYDHVGWNDLDCQKKIRYICQDKIC